MNIREDLKKILRKVQQQECWTDDALEEILTVVKGKGGKMSKLEKLKEVVKIQSSDGNWNANEYMRGMANGLILAESIMENKDPKYLEFERPKDK